MTPFEVNIGEDSLTEFQTLVKCSKIAPATYESLQEDRRYGVTHKWLVEAKARLETFDWYEIWLSKMRFCLPKDRRQRETEINSFPQFKIEIEFSGRAHSIHFCGLFSEQVDATPVLLLHGWPGSFLEFLPILNLLRDAYTPQSLPYHIIAPSLPGYVFSSGPSAGTDFTLLDAAEILNQLMQGLGFESGYIAQGGDVGSKLARILARKYYSCKGESSVPSLNLFADSPPAVHCSCVKHYCSDQQR